MSKFISDLKEGRKAERFVKRLFVEAGITIEKSSNTSKFDFTCKYLGEEASVEIKFDKMNAITGNIALEYWNPRTNKPSGITASKADFVVYVLTTPLTALVCRIDKLRLFIEKNTPDKIITGGGDGNSNMYLYKTQKLNQVFVSLSEVASHERAELLFPCRDTSGYFYL